MDTTIERLIELYATKGAGRYGSELVSQLEHAVQCAELAQAEGASEELVAAAFLHDVGHLVVARPHFLGLDIDDLHQFVGLPFLRALFGPAVLEPIRLHVDAKRYLCLAEPGYRDRLSPASQHSLELQGGPFGATPAQAFLRRPHAGDAVRLRRWDDAAKVPGRGPAALDAVRALLHAAAKRKTERNPTPELQ